MKVAFLLHYVNTMNDNKTGVWGDEIVANAYCKLLNKEQGIEAYTCTYEQVLVNKPDLAVMTAFNVGEPPFVRKIADKTMLWVQGFNYDEKGNVTQLDDMYNGLKPFYDMVVTSSKVMSEKCNIPFVLPVVDMDYHYPVYDVPQEYDVTFIGNIIKPLETNIRYLRPIADFKYGLFGGDFGKLNHEDWLKTTASSKVCLHYHFEDNIKWDMVTASAMFHAACKNFLICDKVPWLQDKFKDGFVFTEGGDEERELIKEYLGNAEERRKYAERAYETMKSIDFSGFLNIVKGV